MGGAPPPMGCKPGGNGEEFSTLGGADEEQVNFFAYVICYGNKI